MRFLVESKTLFRVIHIYIFDVGLYILNPELDIFIRFIALCVVIKKAYVVFTLKQKGRIWNLLLYFLNAVNANIKIFKYAYHASVVAL